MDDDVTMFFTFWGLNALRKPDKQVTTGKTALQKAFATMMPRGPGNSQLSHMNFAGAGPKMFKKAMKDQKVMSLEELIESAREQGVKFVACSMSMDVMGLRPEELIDDVALRRRGQLPRRGRRGQRQPVHLARPSAGSAPFSALRCPHRDRDWSHR